MTDQEIRAKALEAAIKDECSYCTKPYNLNVFYAQVRFISIDRLVIR